MFEAAQVLERVDKLGDLFEPVLKLKQKLPKLAALEKVAAEEEEGIEIAAAAEPAAKPKRVSAPRPKAAVKKSRRV